MTAVKKSNVKKNKIKKEVNETGIGAKKWKNKQRVLLVSSRGVSYLARHVLTNLKTLMPHSKTYSKFDRKHGLM